MSGVITVENATDVKDNIFSVNKLELQQNFPNPLNPSTSISYSLPIFGLISLEVFDVLGREVAILVNEEKPPGSYDVEFSASELSSGVYFYILQSGSFIETKKMILLK